MIKVTFEFRRKVFVTADKVYAFEGLGQADFKYIAVFKKLCFIPPVAVSKEKASDAHSSINTFSRRVRLGS